MKHRKLDKIVNLEVRRLGLDKKKYDSVVLHGMFRVEDYPEWLKRFQDEGIAGGLGQEERDGKEGFFIGIKIEGRCPKSLRRTFRHELAHLKNIVDGKVCFPREKSSPEEEIEREFLARLTAGDPKRLTYLYGLYQLRVSLKLDPKESRSIINSVYLRFFPGTSSRKLDLLFKKFEETLEKRLPELSKFLVSDRRKKEKEAV